MYHGKTIAVVVPCYNEETQILNVISTMPDYVDRIIIVDDCSKDATADVVKRAIASESKSIFAVSWAKPVISDSIYDRADRMMLELRIQEESEYTPSEIINDNDFDRVVLITHLQNAGVGGGISTGYKWCRDHNIDCTAVMAGDGQMDPGELESIIAPVCIDEIDYVKGNRLSHAAARAIVPRRRHFGNTVLSLVTKIASGYWTISDTQTGYTAISFNAMNKIQLQNIYPSYGCPNDILVKLNIANCTIREVPIKPVYAVGEKSKMQISKVIPRISLLLFRSFFCRLYIKYFLVSFHPLFLLYWSSFIAALINIPIFIKIFIDVIVLAGSVSIGYYITFLLLTIFSFQSISFAMWMDIQNNEKLTR